MEFSHLKVMNESLSVSLFEGKEEIKSNESSRKSKVAHRQKFVLVTVDVNKDE